MSSSSTPATKTSDVSTLVAPNPIVGLADDTLGFFGAVGVVKQTLPAEATDPATTMALVNAIRQMLIDHGLAE